MTKREFHNMIVACTLPEFRNTVQPLPKSRRKRRRRVRISAHFYECALWFILGIILTEAVFIMLL